MRASVKAAWVRALRSGEYRQGQNALCSITVDDQDEYCCLGVLFDVAGDGWWVKETETAFDWMAKYGRTADSGVLPENFREVIGLSREDQKKLTGYNDILRHDFNRIATWIEKYL